MLAILIEDNAFAFSVELRSIYFFKVKDGFCDVLDDIDLSSHAL